MNDCRQTEQAPDLLAQARKGHSESLGDLLLRYENYLRILATAQLDHQLRGRISPSDIVQETFFEAHRDFGKFRGASEAEFAAWLRQVLVKNLLRAVDCHILTAKRDVRRELRLEELGRKLSHSSARLEQFLADRNPTPSAEYSRQQRALQVANGLASLPEDYREVVILRNFQGLAFEQVSEIMQRSPGAVRMLWLRALTQLRRILDEDRL